jgi:hypothetical protein
MTGLELSSRRTGVKLCPLYPETGRWRHDFLAARATGYGRQREFATEPESRPSRQVPISSETASGIHGEWSFPAISSHPIGQKFVTLTTGLKVQPTYADGRSKVLILQSSRTRSRRAGRHPMNALRQQFDRANWRCRTKGASGGLLVE